MAANRQDGEQPTERTTLLSERRTVSPSQSEYPLVVLPIVNLIRSQGLHILDEHYAVFPTLPTIVEQTSFRLVVLLQLYVSSQKANIASRDVWDRWSKERDAVNDASQIERRIDNTWTTFIEPGRSSQEIEDCLWSYFLVEDGKTHTPVLHLLSGVVVDILQDTDAPSSLLAHRLILLSLDHTWRYGRSLPPSTSFLARSLRRFDTLGTPRVLHAIEMLLQMGYLAILVHYITCPPSRPIINALSSGVGAREILLIIYAIASLCRRWTSYAMPYLLVLSAFLSSLPSFPSSGDTSYILLLIALVSHILLLHLPRPPSPNFFVNAQISLPLSTLLWHEFTRTVCSALVFYFPAFLLSCYLVSLSLADSIPHFPRIQNLVAAPIETRQAFAVLWAIVVYLICISIGLLVLFSASLLSLSNHPSNPWDRFSRPVGLQARRIFISTVAMYNTPYLFPPPFNLIQLIFIRLPVIALHLAGQKEPLFMRVAESMLWRCTVGFISGPLAGFWLWAR